MAFTAVELIESKRDGRELSPDAIEWLIEKYTDGVVPDYQMAAMAMAIYHQRHDRRRARRLDERDAPFRRGLRLERRRRGKGRQTLDRRRRRQDLHSPRSAGRLGRSRRADDVGTRVGSHRRHARQAGDDPRVHHRARSRPFPQGALGSRHGVCRADRDPGPGRPEALCPSRRHRHGPVTASHLLVDHVEEAGRGSRRPGPRCQDRHRRVHEGPRRIALAGPHHGGHRLEDTR